MNGMDISAWQDNVNLKNITFDFCVVKATQGTNYKNRYMSKQCKQVIQRGKLLGVYHYAEGNDWKTEADHFLKTVKPYIGKALLCLDWESEDNPYFGHLDKEWTKNFCDYIKLKTGCTPFIYVQKSMMTNVCQSYPLWVAQYADDNVTGYQRTPWNEGAYKCAIRQYTRYGKLNNYDGYLDLDKAYITSAQWKKYAGIKTSTSSKKKSLDVIAQEVLAGKWGNADARKKKLTTAGYDYDKVQAKVNALLAKPDYSKIAMEVIAGKWGNGNARKTKLTNAGYDYDKIQLEVNKLLGV